MTPRSFHQAEPTREIAAAMLEADVNVLVPTKALLHSRAGHAAMKAGHPCIASEELSVAMLAAGAATADYEPLQALGQKLLDIYLAEIAIGTNPNARITGVMRENKKLEGSVHIALGASSDTGGLVDSKTHIDGKIRRPTVTIDNRVVVENGRIAV
jgi:hypothetical protein